jgi:hypothetical protein
MNDKQTEVNKSKFQEGRREIGREMHPAQLATCLTWNPLKEVKIHHGTENRRKEMKEDRGLKYVK